MKCTIKAFTLLEILAVIAILAIIAGILFPVLRNAQAQSRVSEDISNLRQIGQAQAIYQNDTGTEIFRCAPLVKAKLIPKEICVSQSDQEPDGIANAILNNLAADSPEYQSTVDSFRKSYLGITDVILSNPATTENIRESGSAGWLANLARIERPINVRANFIWKGRYERLLFDGAVINRTFAQYTLPNKPHPIQVGSPVFLFCEPSSKWINEIISR